MGELEFLEQLVLFRQPSFGTKLPLRGIEAGVESRDAERVVLWLRLIAPWTNHARDYGAALTSALELAMQTEDPAFVQRVVESLAELRKWESVPALAGELRPLIRGLLAHDNARVRLAVCTLYGVVGRGDDAGRMQDVMLDTTEDVRVRQVGLHAFAKLAGAGAVEAVVKLGGDDPVFTVDAVEALRVIADPRGMPFIADVAKNHHNWLTRDRAAAALLELEAPP